MSVLHTKPVGLHLFWNQQNFQTWKKNDCDQIQVHDNYYFFFLNLIIPSQ